MFCDTMAGGGEASDGIDRMSNDRLGQLKAESRVKANGNGGWTITMPPVVPSRKFGTVALGSQVRNSTIHSPPALFIDTGEAILPLYQCLCLPSNITFAPSATPRAENQRPCAESNGSEKGPPLRKAAKQLQTIRVRCASADSNFKGLIIKQGQTFSWDRSQGG